MTIVVKEAVSDLAGTLGDAFDGLMVGFDDPDQRALLAVEDPAWSTTPGGILAYGECPQIAGHVGDATILAHVFVPDAAFCVFGECGAMRLTCTPSGSGWKAGVSVFTPGGTATALSDELPLSTSDGTYIAATYNAATGETKLYLAGVEANDTTFGEARVRVSALPIWRVGAPPGGWVTDFALFDRILDPEEMPGFVAGPTVTINQGSGQSDPTTSSSIVFDVLFSEAVTGFTTGDVTLGGSAGATTAIVSGSGTTYTVTVSGMTGPGTVTASIAAAVATSIATSLPNEASTSTDNTVTYDEWTPADIDGISLKFWYKGDAGVTDAGAGAVSAWNDQSSNGFHLSQATGGLRPTTGAATLNGLNVLTFAGDYMAQAAAASAKFLHDGTEHLVVAVVKFGASSNPNTGYGLMGTNGTASASVGMALYWEDTSPTGEEVVFHHVTRGVGGSHVVRNFSAAEGVDMTPAQDWCLVTLLGDPDLATAANRSTLHTNRGIRVKANGDANAVSASNPTHALSIGSCANGVYPMTGAIAEIVCTTSWADRANVEQYLANKYNLTPVEFDPSTEVTVQS